MSTVLYLKSLLVCCCVLTPAIGGYPPAQPPVLRVRTKRQTNKGVRAGQARIQGWEGESARRPGKKYDEHEMESQQLLDRKNDSFKLVLNMFKLISLYCSRVPVRTVTVPM